METLTENVQTLAYDKSGKLSTKDQTLTLIPYFAWAHRGNGNMKVWLPQDVKAAKPSAPATLAAQAKVEFSSPVPAKSSITDGLVPADENDRSVPYIHWWSKKNTTEWITPSQRARRSRPAPYIGTTTSHGAVARCQTAGSSTIRTRQATGRKFQEPMLIHASEV